MPDTAPTETNAETIERLRAELIEVADGRRSGLNIFMDLEADHAQRQQTLAECARFDAFQVAVLSYALSGLCCVEAMKSTFATQASVREASDLLQSEFGGTK